MDASSFLLNIVSSNSPPSPAVSNRTKRLQGDRSKKFSLKRNKSSSKSRYPSSSDPKKHPHSSTTASFPSSSSSSTSTSTSTSSASPKASVPISVSPAAKSLAKNIVSKYRVTADPSGSAPTKNPLVSSGTSSLRSSSVPLSALSSSSPSSSSSSLSSSSSSSSSISSTTKPKISFSIIETNEGSKKKQQPVQVPKQHELAATSTSTSLPLTTSSTSTTSGSSEKIVDTKNVPSSSDSKKSAKNSSQNDFPDGDSDSESFGLNDFEMVHASNPLASSTKDDNADLEMLTSLADSTSNGAGSSVSPANLSPLKASYPYPFAKGTRDRDNSEDAGSLLQEMDQQTFATVDNDNAGLDPFGQTRLEASAFIRDYRPRLLSMARQDDGEDGSKEREKQSVMSAASVFAASSFASLRLSNAMVTALKDSANIIRPTRVQDASIRYILDRVNVLIRANTGTGKTIAYLAPIVDTLAQINPRICRQSGTFAVVLVPTRELATQVYSDLHRLVLPAFHWIVPCVLSGGQKRAKEKAHLRKGATILVCTPGRLLDHLENTASLNTGPLQFVVLDEADRLMDAGFEKKVRDSFKLLKARAEFPKDIRVILTSATESHGGLNRLVDLLARGKNPPLYINVGERDVPTSVTELDTAFPSSGTDADSIHQSDSEKSTNPTTDSEKSNGTAPAAGSGTAASSSSRLDSAGHARSLEILRDLDLGGNSDSSAVALQAPHQLKQLFVEVPRSLRLVAFVSFLRWTFSKLYSHEPCKIVVFVANIRSVEFHTQLLHSFLKKGTSTLEDEDDDEDMEYFEDAEDKADQDVEEKDDDQEEEEEEEELGGKGMEREKKDKKGKKKNDKENAKGKESQGIGLHNSNGSEILRKRKVKFDDDDDLNGGNGDDDNDDVVLDGSRGADEEADEDADQNGSFGTGSGSAGGKDGSSALPLSINAKMKGQNHHFAELSSSASPVLDGAVVSKLHGDMLPAERMKVYSSFRSSSRGVLICTDVAARGLHFPDVDWILQYDPPTETTEYVHRVGRTARLGRQGRAVLFLQPTETGYVDVLRDHGLELSELELADVFGSLRFNRKMRLHVTPEAILRILLERHVQRDPLLISLAREAYSAFIRSYMTYSKSLRHVFHVKHLHFGHVAASFGLKDTPSKMAAVNRRGVKEALDFKRQGAMKGTLKLARSSGTMIRAPLSKRKRLVTDAKLASSLSEFAAGF